MVSTRTGRHSMEGDDDDGEEEELLETQQPEPITAPTKASSKKKKQQSKTAARQPSTKKKSPPVADPAKDKDKNDGEEEPPLTQKTTQEPAVESETEDEQEPAAAAAVEKPAPKSKAAAVAAAVFGNDDSTASTEEILEPDELEMIQQMYTNLDALLQTFITESPAQRQLYWRSIKFFRKHYRFGDLQFGRIYTRLLMAQCLLEVHVFPTYGSDAVPMADSMVAWHPDTWQDYLGGLRELQKACRRRDRNVPLLTPQDVQQQKDDHPVEPLHGCFTIGLDKLISSCRCNQFVAPLRLKLEKQLAAGSTGAPRVKAEKVQALL